MWVTQNEQKFLVSREKLGRINTTNLSTINLSSTISCTLIIAEFACVMVVFAQAFNRYDTYKLLKHLPIFALFVRYVFNTGLVIRGLSVLQRPALTLQTWKTGLESVNSYLSLPELTQPAMILQRFMLQSSDL